MNARDQFLVEIASYAAELPRFGGTKGRTIRIENLQAEKDAVHEHAYKLDDGPRRQIALAVAAAIDKMIDRELNAALRERVDRGELPESCL